MICRAVLEAPVFAHGRFDAHEEEIVAGTRDIFEHGFQRVVLLPDRNMDIAFAGHILLRGSRRE